MDKFFQFIKTSYTSVITRNFERIEIRNNDVLILENNLRGGGLSLPSSKWQKQKMWKCVHGLWD